MLKKFNKSLILNKKIILASTSVYRAALLARLQIAFTVEKPGVDETPYDAETAPRLAARLSGEKAIAVARFYQRQDVLVIGADQVAELEGEPFGQHLSKPGSRKNALSQLRSMRGRQAIFHSGLAIYDCATDNLETAVVATQVTMRNYTDAQIEHYLDHEAALDCAGSAKCEGLGIALIAGVQSDDPTALTGLPLIVLTEMLARAGVDVLSLT